MSTTDSDLDLEALANKRKTTQVTDEAANILAEEGLDMAGFEAYQADRISGRVRN
jgi:hypothetical protein